MAEGIIDTVIGIDLSYKRTSVSVCRNGRILSHTSITPIASDCPSEKRKYIINGIKQSTLDNAKLLKLDPDKTIVVTERIRLFSSGFLSMDYIVKTGALVALIIDLFYEHNIELFLVDTRSWKKAVIGSSKPEDNRYGIDPKKWPTIKHVKNMPEIKNRDIMIETKKAKKGTIERKGKYYLVNDDVCDAICISKMFFIPGYGNMHNLKKAEM